jgi:hypothetical protein
MKRSDEADMPPAMTADQRTPVRMSRRLQAFASALDRAGTEYITARGVAPDDSYRLFVEECPVHGTRCARVTYGILRDHVLWGHADVRQLAACLLKTMLAPTRPPKAP